MKNDKTFNIEKVQKTKLLDRVKLDPTGVIDVSSIPHYDTEYATMSLKELEYTLEFEEHSKSDKKIIKELIAYKLKNK
ncbi:MAG: hypothetical protein LBF02_01145 [Mycoplasmataceae bacterium]|jgi:mannitol/fructose-specific phosphotransferase system IIA component (Ntr-type)|nr:hypothetical protein [Mycoplasmataceae bacterium]